MGGGYRLLLLLCRHDECVNNVSTLMETQFWTRWKGRKDSEEEIRVRGSGRHISLPRPGAVPGVIRKTPGFQVWGPAQSMGRWRGGKFGPTPS